MKKRAEDVRMRGKRGDERQVFRKREGGKEARGLGGN